MHNIGQGAPYRLVTDAMLHTESVSAVYMHDDYFPDQELLQHYEEVPDQMMNMSHVLYL